MDNVGNQTTVYGVIPPEQRRNVRTLAIEAAGDFCYGKVTPKIRLAGRWLERAGFKPGHRVEVRLDQPGTITLRFVAETPAAVTPSL
jgi:hypothetical protein